MRQQGWDDITCVDLDPKGARRSRISEIDYAKNKNESVSISRKQVLRQGWKIVKIRWIDINQGDNENPIMRSRQVGKYFNAVECRFIVCRQTTTERALRL